MVFDSLCTSLENFGGKRRSLPHAHTSAGGFTEFQRIQRSMEMSSRLKNERTEKMQDMVKKKNLESSVFFVNYFVSSQFWKKKNSHLQNFFLFSSDFPEILIIFCNLFKLIFKNMLFSYVNSKNRYPMSRSQKQHTKIS